MTSTLRGREGVDKKEGGGRGSNVKQTSFVHWLLGRPKRCDTLYSQWVVNHGLVPGSTAGGALAHRVVDQRWLPLPVRVILPVIRLLRSRIRNLA